MVTTLECLFENCPWHHPDFDLFERTSVWKVLEIGCARLLLNMNAFEDLGLFNVDEAEARKVPARKAQGIYIALIGNETK